MIDTAFVEQRMRDVNPVSGVDDIKAEELSRAVAATHTRRAAAMQTSTQHQTPTTPPLLRRRAWAFAAAFVAVVVAVGLAALLLSGTESSVIDQPATTIDSAATSTTNWFNVPMQAPAAARVSQWIVAPDGTEWRVEGGELGRYDGTQFTSVGAPETSDSFDPVGISFAVTTDGTVWTSGWGGSFWTADLGSLARFDGTAWELMRPLGDKELPAAALAATPDGSLWAVIVDFDGEELVEWTLAQFDGSDWTLYPQATEFSAGFPQVLEASGDTVLLANGSWGDDPLFMGVVVSDGQSWRHYLDDEMVIGISIRPDGTVLAHTAESGRQRLDL